MRRSLVRIAIALIAANAALAIGILVSGEMGETGGKILGTSLLATATALVVMVQFPALADRRLGVVPVLAMAAAGIGFAVVVTGIWSEMDSQLGWKIGGSGYVLGVAGAIAAILAGLRIEGSAAWVGGATVAVVGTATAMILAGIWFEIDSEGYWRTFAVVAVLVAAGGLAVPILSRSSEGARSDMAVIACPFCANDLGLQRASDAVCSLCGSRFSVHLIARAPGSGVADDDE